MQVEELTTAELSKAGSKKSHITLKSGKKLEISLVEGSFRRITGIREQMDDSGSAIIRRVEIKREPGKSLGFYISQGDGWMRRDGIFVSRVNLGSAVETSGLLNVGDEIVKVNNVDVTKMILDDVVLVMQYVKRMILTVKILTAFGFTNHLSMHRSLIKRDLPRTPSEDDISASRNKRLSTYLKMDDDDASLLMRRVRFQRQRDTLTGSMIKSTHFGGSFVRKMDSPSSADIQLEMVGDSRERKDDISIDPYETTSFDSSKKLTIATTEEEDDISPYARVSLRTDSEKGVMVEVHPQKARKEASTTHPYEDVEMSTGSKGGGVGRDKSQAARAPYEEIELSTSKKPPCLFKSMTFGPNKTTSATTPYEEVETEFSKSADDSEIDPYSSVNFKSDMKMDGLLELIRRKPLHSSSPAVKRKSDIIEEKVLYPDHIYAQVDKTRKYSSNGSDEVEEGGSRPERKSERALSNATPPPRPTSPLPSERDITDMPLITAGELGGSQEESGTDSPVISHHLMDLTDESDSESSLDGKRQFEQLPELGDAERAPPLPPPYVHGGPPESTDEEEETEEEGDEEEQQEGSRTRPLSGTDKSAVTTDLPVIIVTLEDENVPTSPPPSLIEEQEGYQVETGVESKSSAEEVTTDITSVTLYEAQQQDSSEESFGEDVMQVRAKNEAQDLSLVDQEKKHIADAEDMLTDSIELDPAGLDFTTITTNSDLAVEEETDEKLKRRHSFPALNMSRDSCSSLPPPPPPPGEPPLEDDEEEGGSYYSYQQDDAAKSFSLLPTSSKDTQGDRLVSGVVSLRIHGLDVSNEASRSFWLDYDVQKVTFVMALDGKVKVTANVSMVEGLGETSAALDVSDEDEEYCLLLLKRSKVTFTVNPVCLPAVSKYTSLAEIFPEGEGTKRDVYVDFDNYGRLQLSLKCNPLSRAIPRMEADGYSKPSFSDLVSFNPRQSGSPLILEQCIDIIEQYGLKMPHLYERCTPTSHKHRALAACVDNLKSQSVKNVVMKCSVHAYTGLIVDFFCELPEPFLTNDISPSLTQAVGTGGGVAVLESFMHCLPEDVAKTLQLLTRHFQKLLKHSGRNGVSMKSLCGLFGPLLLIPSLSPDLNTSTTALEFAEEFESQAKVMELLLSMKHTD